MLIDLVIPELGRLLLLNKYAIKFIPSETMKKFLDSVEYSSMLSEKIFSKEIEGGLGLKGIYPHWTYMQLATIADQFLRGKKKVRFLKKLTDNCPETEIKVLLRKAAKDFAKNKYRAYKGCLSPKTFKYYDKISKPEDPVSPFEEIMFYPNIFKKGDVVSWRNRKNKKEYFIVWGVPNYEKNIFCDGSDESICAIDLKGMKDLLDDEKMFYWHSHFLPSSLNIVEDKSIPAKYREVVDFYREKYCKEEEKPKTIVNTYTKQEEMWERAKKRFGSKT